MKIELTSLRKYCLILFSDMHQVFISIKFYLTSMNMVFNRIFNCDFHWAISWDVLTAMYLSNLRRIHHKLHWCIYWILKTVEIILLRKNHIVDVGILYLKHYTIIGIITYLKWTEVLNERSTVTSTSLSVPLFTLTCKAQFTASVISTETYEMAWFRCYINTNFEMNFICCFLSVK